MRTQLIFPKLTRSFTLKYNENPTKVITFSESTLEIKLMSLREKCPNKEFFSGSYLPVLGLDTEIYSVDIRIQSDYRKIRTRKNSVFGHFSRSVKLHYMLPHAKKY